MSTNFCTRYDDDNMDNKIEIKDIACKPNKLLDSHVYRDVRFKGMQVIVLS